MEKIKFETAEEMYRRLLIEGAKTSKSMAEMQEEVEIMDVLEAEEELMEGLDYADFDMACYEPEVRD